MLALADAAHAVPDLQTDIPEQGQKAADGLMVMLAAAAIAQQDQQVDVRMRIQFATTVTADRQQGNVGVRRTVKRRPGLTQYLVGQPGSLVKQLATSPAPFAARLGHGISLAQGILEGAGGATRGGQVCSELARVNKLMIHSESSAIVHLG